MISPDGGKCFLKYGDRKRIAAELKVDPACLGFGRSTEKGEGGGGDFDGFLHAAPPLLQGGRHGGEAPPGR